MHETDTQKERRLAGEAATHCLGILTSNAAEEGEQLTTVRVEVTIGEAGEERCGYLVVYVPSRESDDLEDHPATFATDTVQAWGNRQGFEYFSIDDTRSH